ncbi:hypothetical protein [Streptomyces litchfieldiae]|uniref:Secreted protein n=1 Tax=Streptomyces litchfieldiae TaxID=3075543 RepID=A0ABU2MWY2_9ACTN|nr:hypothetical protein [Streptomyces sp. DSM 44938]MDT0346161.1 hypothetical protein [Streptomyces sp. DSM 44938]
MRRLPLSVGAVAGLALVLLLPGQAAAGPVDRGEGDQEGPAGGRDGQTIHAEAVVFDESANGRGDSAGPLTSTSTSWSPPPCWYAPTWTPEQLRAHAEEFWDPASQPAGHGQSALGWMWDHYDEGNPYTGFNEEEAGNGMWWGPVENENHPDIMERLSCSEIPFWVETGDVPDVENALSPEVLAELAYERLRVPGTSVELSPADLDGQVVNLATWAWSDGGDFAPVSVTARLESWGIWATTTARPVSLRLDPGTGDAVSHPASGECAIGADGAVGSPFDPSRAEDDPPCGVTYLRATPAGETYPLTASITWEIGWEGSDGSGDVLPDAVFETTYDVEVQEIQAIVR